MTESDWKIFKQIHAVARERYYMRCVTELAKILNDNSRSYRDRFIVPAEMSDKLRREASEMFDDYRRSTALLKLTRMQYERLVDDGEMARFSPELQESVRLILSHGK
ncbi:MAG TPA: hypothetical protein VL992_10115 [Tepidisphaeraceae bacterium]|nr:hypothetical protein [Tepidisphaeraceae bacterium]